MLTEVKQELIEQFDPKRSEIYKQEVKKQAKEFIDEQYKEDNLDSIIKNLAKNEYLSEATKRKILSEEPRFKNLMSSVLKEGKVGGEKDELKDLLKYLIDIEIFKKIEKIQAA